MRCLSFLSIRVPSTYHDWSDRRQGRNCSPLGRYISVHFALLFSASADIVAVDSPRTRRRRYTRLHQRWSHFYRSLYHFQSMATFNADHSGSPVKAPVRRSLTPMVPPAVTLLLSSQPQVQAYTQFVEQLARVAFWHPFIQA